MASCKATDDSGNEYWIDTPSETGKKVHSSQGSAPVSGLSVLKTRCGKILRPTSVKGVYVIVLTGAIIRSQDPHAS